MFNSKTRSPLFRLIACLSGFLCVALQACAGELFNQQSSLGECVSMLRKKGISKIDGEIITTVTFSYSKDEIEKKVHERRSELEKFYKPSSDDIITKDNIDRAVTNYQSDLMKGQRSVRKFSLFLGKDSILLNYVENFASATVSVWELQTPTALSSYNAFNETVTVTPDYLSRATSLGSLVYALGQLGQSGINLEKLNGLDGFSEEKNQLSQENDGRSILLKLSKNPMLIEERITTILGDNYNDKFLFKDYEEFKFGKIPKKIECIMNFGEVIRKTEVAIKNVDNSTSVDEIVALPLFGKVSVNDARFEEPISYGALDILPSDKVVVKLLRDPEYLRRYNLEVKERMER